MSSRAKKKRARRPPTASNVVRRDFVDGVRVNDRFTVLSVREAVAQLEAANVSPWRCPACGKKFYITLPEGQWLPASARHKVYCRDCEAMRGIIKP